MSVKNGQKYVSKSIESMLDQSFEKFEFLIIDDGSEDGTWDILNRNRDKRVKLFRNRLGMGLTKSLNFLLGKCRGRYIARIDADDLSFKDRIETQCQFLDKNPETDLTASFCRIVDGDDLEITNYCPGYDSLSLKWAIIFRNVIRHSTTMWRKEIGIYNENFLYSQDHEMWSRSKCPTIIKKILADIRMHPDSITWKKKKEQDEFSIEVTRRQIEYYSKRKIETNQAKKIKMICLHKTEKEVQEFKEIGKKDILESIPIYMDLAKGFIDTHGQNVTILDEICWDLYGLIKLRPEWKNDMNIELERWLDRGEKDFFKQILARIP
jgi:glycosyltransferase involved in cell wall biosynthesis